MSAGVIGRWLGRAMMLVALAFGVVAVSGTAASADSGAAVQSGAEWN